MLTRISLIVAIIAGLAVGALNFVKVKEKITTLQTNLKDETDAHQKAQASLNSTKKELDSTKKTLDQTKQSLDTAVTEKDKAVKDRDGAVKRATQLTEDLATSKAKLEETQADLASYKGTGLTPQQILALNKDMKELQNKLVESLNIVEFQRRKIIDLTNQLAVYKIPDYHIRLSPTLTGKVLITDPKWNFVILNIGQDQGALERGELLVSRNGQFVAKVKITSVQKDRSIANVIPGPSKLGDPMEGDIVIPAYPAS